MCVLACACLQTIRQPLLVHCSAHDTPISHFSANPSPQGMTEEEADEQLDNVAVYTNRVTPLICAVTGSKRPVFIKLIVDMDTDIIKASTSCTVPGRVMLC